MVKCSIDPSPKMKRIWSGKCSASYFGIIFSDAKGDMLTLGGGFVEAKSGILCINGRPKPDGVKPAAICVICMDQYVSRMCEPCRHACLCSNCVEKISDKICPICRGEIFEFSNIIIP